MSQRAVVLDANVLIPAAPRDTLLRSAERGLFRLCWSEQILGEVERNLVERLLISAADARDLLDEMRAFFPEAMVALPILEIDAPAVHPKDRHVLEAAVAANASVIVTENLRDFPAEDLARHGIVAESIDEFLVVLARESPESMLKIVIEQAADLGDPVISPTELLTHLARWAPVFVAQVQSTLRDE